MSTRKLKRTGTALEAAQLWGAEEERSKPFWAKLS
jgi:hypothetical protein